MVVVASVVVVVVVEGVVVEVVVVGVVEVEVLMVEGAMVVGGRGARGGGVGVKAEATEASVSSTTREEVGESKGLKISSRNIQQVDTHTHTHRRHQTLS